LSPPEILPSHPLVEQILDGHRNRAGNDDLGFAGYKGHVYRVLNLTRALAPDDTDDRDEKLAIVAAFHDLEGFSSLDYLAPSIRTQDAWLQQTGREQWSDELAVIIAAHHRFTPYRGPYAQLAEPFRRADLVDVSQGLIHPGISRAYVREVRRAFDVGPFFTRVLPMTVVRRVISHPLDPMPHLRTRRGLRQSGHADADR
jgi:hypothetical protein